MEVPIFFSSDGRKDILSLFKMKKKTNKLHQNLWRTNLNID